MEIISVIIAFIIGLVIGFIVKSLLKQNAQPNTNPSETAKLKHEFTLYQQQVSQHMTKTADLVSGLKQQYDAIQQHIFSGATALNRDSDRHSFLQPKTHETYTDPAVEALKQQAHQDAAVERNQADQ